MKRKQKTRYWCTGVELIESTMLVKTKEGVKEVGRVRVRRCREQATVIAQVALPVGMKELCDDCLKRYRKAKIVTRTLVDLAAPHKEPKR